MAWTNPTITDATQQISKIEYYQDGVLKSDDVQALMYAASKSGSASYVWKHPYTISVSSGTQYATLSFTATDYYTQSITATGITGVSTYPTITINGTTTTVTNITRMQTGYLTRRFYWTGTGSVKSDKSVVLNSEDIDREYTSTSPLFYSYYGIKLTSQNRPTVTEAYIFQDDSVTGNATVKVTASSSDNGVVTLTNFGEIGTDVVTMTINADNPAFDFKQPSIGEETSGDFVYMKMYSTSSTATESSIDVVSCPYGTTLAIGTQNFAYDNFILTPRPHLNWTKVSGSTVQICTFSTTGKTEPFSFNLTSSYNSAKPLLLLIVSNFNAMSAAGFSECLCGRIYSDDASTSEKITFSTGTIFTGTFIPIPTGTATVTKTDSGYTVSITRLSTSTETFYIYGAYQPS